MTDFNLTLFAPSYLSWPDALMRIAASVIFALAIGMERYLRRKPVDFRPFVIISLASCALAIAIIEVAAGDLARSLSVDPGKVISGVMSGIGFLGAGALFREEHVVQGAGSAAAIWAAGAIGLVCGLGAVWLGAIVAIVIIVVLLISRPWTSRYDATSGDDE